MSTKTAGRRPPVAPPIALVGATIAISFSVIFIRIAGDDPATIVWLRMAIAALVLAPWSVLDARRGQHLIDTRMGTIVIFSGTLLAGHFLLWTASLSYTSIAASVLLVSLHPLMVLPLSRYILGVRTPLPAQIGLALALIGTAITCVADFRLGGGALRGDLFALAAAACLAGYLIIGRRVRASLGVAAYSSSLYATAASVAAVAAAATHQAHLPGLKAVLACIALAIVCTIFGHTVYNWALRYLQSTTVSVAFLGEPPLAAVLALLILGAVPTLTTIAGGALILGGLWLILNHETRLPQAAAITVSRP